MLLESCNVQSILVAGPEPLLTEYRIHHGPKSCDPCGSSIRETQLVERIRYMPMMFVSYAAQRALLRYGRYYIEHTVKKRKHIFCASTKTAFCFYKLCTAKGQLFVDFFCQRSIRKTISKKLQAQHEISFELSMCSAALFKSIAKTMYLKGLQMFEALLFCSTYVVKPVLSYMWSRNVSY